MNLVASKDRTTDLLFRYSSMRQSPQASFRVLELSVTAVADLRLENPLLPLGPLKWALGWHLDLLESIAGKDEDYAALGLHAPELHSSMIGEFNTANYVRVYFSINLRAFYFVLHESFCACED